MIRAATVIAVASLCAALLGVDRRVWAAEDAASQTADRQAVASRLARIDVGSVVSVDRLDGSRIDGVLTAKTPDSITVDVYQRRAFRRPRLVRTDTIPLDDIKAIGEALTAGQKAAITAGILVGACAIAISVVATSLDSQRPVVAPEQSPSTGEQRAPTVPDPAEPTI